jgi:hypothetical protein
MARHMIDATTFIILGNGLRDFFSLHRRGT